MNRAVSKEGKSLLLVELIEGNEDKGVVVMFTRKCYTFSKGIKDLELPKDG
jgi:hypothetical protein